MKSTVKRGRATFFDLSEFSCRDIYIRPQALAHVFAVSTTGLQVLFSIMAFIMDGKAFPDLTPEFNNGMASLDQRVGEDPATAGQSSAMAAVRVSSK
jgi:hypothetical protein